MEVGEARAQFVEIALGRPRFPTDPVGALRRAGGEVHPPPGAVARGQAVADIGEADSGAAARRDFGRVAAIVLDLDVKPPGFLIGRDLDGDGAAGDGIFGGVTTNFPAGHKIHYYIEARSANLAKAASFAPANAEVDTFSYRVGLVSAETTPVVINEVMSSNTRTIADPQGEFDDWIELRNLTASEVDMTGRYLSDEPNNPTKWQFPAGTKIPANGYIIVWADEDGLATEGLHCSFKLSAEGEAIFLTDTDANQNAVLDSLDYEVQEPDRSFGRPAANPEEFVVMDATPGEDNE